MQNSNPATPQVEYHEDDEINLRDLLDVILQHKWLGLAVFFTVLVLGIFYLFVATPIYQTDALVQVEKQQSVVPGMDDMSSLLSSRYGYSEAQIEVIRSRSVLSRVVSELDLDVGVTPMYFPVIGEALARRNMGGLLRAMFPGYVWGGESIDVTRLETSEGLKGRALLLRVEEEGQYSLHLPEGEQLLTGQAGKPAEAMVGEEKIAVFVRGMNAEPGTQFMLASKRPASVVKSLQRNLVVSERGRMTGVIALSFTGPDPQRITAILTSLVNNYVRQNVEQRSEQASKSLEFLNEQLPGLKQNVADAESALQEYKSRQGSAVDLSVKGEAILTQASELETRISELKLQRSELRSRFTEQSQAIRTIDQQLAQLQAAKRDIEKELDTMPQTELEIIRLIRDVKVANELYVQLLNKAQEFKVAKAGTIGDARILDTPVKPWRASSPVKSRILLLSILLGTIAGIGAIFLRRSLKGTLETPEAIESQLGLSVFATIPHSNIQARNGSVLLSKTHPGDTAVESLRSLRTSLQFALMSASNNIVCIHGPTPSIGKSFVAVNLAFLLGDTDKKVLLIDCDMRKGHMHKQLGKPRSPGLSEVLSGTAQASEVLHRFEDGKVNFLSTGRLPPNPAELLVHDRFSALLEHASKTFDLIVIDTPPTLNLADSINIGKHCGVNFMVVRGGVNTLQDARMAHRRMEQNGIRLDGVIFNDLSASASKYRYGGYYTYKYKKS